LESWISQCHKLVAVELGAGRAIPTVRRFGEHYSERLIRINPREFKVRDDHGIGIAGGALDSLDRIERLTQTPQEDQQRASRSKGPSAIVDGLLETFPSHRSDVRGETLAATS